MTVTPLAGIGSGTAADAGIELDAPRGAAPPQPGAATSGGGFAAAVADAFSSASDSLVRADRAERAFVHGRGGLQEMVLERAQADVAVQLASAAASHVTQSLTTILGMQI